MIFLGTSIPVSFNLTSINLILLHVYGGVLFPFQLTLHKKSVTLLLQSMVAVVIMIVRDIGKENVVRLHKSNERVYVDLTNSNQVT